MNKQKEVIKNRFENKFPDSIRKYSRELALKVWKIDNKLNKANADDAL